MGPAIAMRMDAADRVPDAEQLTLLREDGSLAVHVSPAFHAFLESVTSDS